MKIGSKEAARSAAACAEVARFTGLPFGDVVGLPVRQRRDLLSAARRASDRQLETLYFIQSVDGGPIKIGRARDVKRRMAQLQIGSPVWLELLLAVHGVAKQAETDLHQRLAHCRVHGEWFIDCDAVRFEMKSFLIAAGVL